MSLLACWLVGLLATQLSLLWPKYWQNLNYPFSKAIAGLSVTPTLHFIPFKLPFRMQHTGTSARACVRGTSHTDIQHKFVLASCRLVLFHYPKPLKVNAYNGHHGTLASDTAFRLCRYERNETCHTYIAEINYSLH